MMRVEEESNENSNREQESAAASRNGPMRRRTRTRMEGTFLRGEPDDASASATLAIVHPTKSGRHTSNNISIHTNNKSSLPLTLASIVTRCCQYQPLSGASAAPSAFGETASGSIGTKTNDASKKYSDTQTPSTMHTTDCAIEILRRYHRTASTDASSPELGMRSAASAIAAHRKTLENNALPTETLPLKETLQAQQQQELLLLERIYLSYATAFAFREPKPTSTKPTAPPPKTRNEHQNAHSDEDRSLDLEAAILHVRHEARKVCMDQEQRSLQLVQELHALQQSKRRLQTHWYTNVQPEQGRFYAELVQGQEQQQEQAPSRRNTRSSSLDAAAPVNEGIDAQDLANQEDIIENKHPATTTPDDDHSLFERQVRENLFYRRLLPDLIAAFVPDWLHASPSSNNEYMFQRYTTTATTDASFPIDSTPTHTSPPPTVNTGDDMELEDVTALLPTS